MPEIEIHGVDKSLPRTFEIEWGDMIHTRRDWKVWMKKETLSVG